MAQRPRLMEALRSALFVLVLAAAATVASTAGAAPLRPLERAFVDPIEFTSPTADLALEHAARAGATAIKVPVFWDTIAPATRPSRFNPADPLEPAYYWKGLDTELRLVRSHGLEPIVYIAGPPTWAKRKVDGFLRVDPAQYRLFVLAAVRRYSGKTQGLPRVRYWEAWNEPNKVPGPEFKPGAGAWYRELVNAFAQSAHTVKGNAVIAGGLAPFGISTAVAPLAFMRSLLCLSSGGKPHATCPAKVHFDIWSTDPYSAGGPTSHAYRKNDVSIGDLPEMKAVLDAGVRLGRIVSTQPVRFWVTEFSWDSNPPDPKGVPVGLEGRWVAEALYRMWSSGVSLVTWFTLRDQSVRTSPYQSGLYFRGGSLADDRPKPALTAFRFPFVAFPRSRKVFVWARTPAGKSATIVVEQRGSSGWRRLGVLHANRVGIASATLPAHGRGPVRGHIRNDASLPFSLVAPPDRVFQPFGS
jgi:hypothetical protein